MKIKGLQKLTLIDYPEKLACTIFLFGCNFRCGFCHNPELVINDYLPEISQEKIIDFLQRKKKYLDAVCFTGGEPLITLEEDFIRKVKSLGYLIKIDTNGSFPDKLREFISKGLVDFVAMDVKSGREKYSHVCGTEVEILKIEESIKIISQLPKYEFRTTIIYNFHDEQEVINIIGWIKGITHTKIKRFGLQGFKKEEKLLDETFNLENNVNEDFLLKLKEKIKEDCEEVIIRV